MRSNLPKVLSEKERTRRIEKAIKKALEDKLIEDREEFIDEFNYVIEGLSGGCEYRGAKKSWNEIDKYYKAKFPHIYDPEGELPSEYYFLETTANIAIREAKKALKENKALPKCECCGQVLPDKNVA